MTPQAHPGTPPPHLTAAHSTLSLPPYHKTGTVTPLNPPLLHSDYSSFLRKSAETVGRTIHYSFFSWRVIEGIGFFCNFVPGFRIFDMEKIELHKVLPKVFAGREDDNSEVWLREVTLERGKHYLISAESGTGKSSLCSYLYGFRTDYTGSIAFDGADIRHLGVNEWCRLRSRHIAYLPQELRLFPELTAMENVELANRLNGFKTRQQILQLFEQLGIADKTDSPVARLSIGQQQRVAIIRTLCQPCDFILLDEPVSHLDTANNRIVAEMVTAEALAQGAGIISTSVGNNVLIAVDKEFKL